MCCHGKENIEANNIKSKKNQHGFAEFHFYGNGVILPLSKHNLKL